MPVLVAPCAGRCFVAREYLGVREKLATVWIKPLVQDGGPCSRPGPFLEFQSGQMFQRLLDWLFSRGHGPGDHDTHQLVKSILQIIRQHQYEPHVGGKLDVRRSHQRQVVTGLVVNDRANLAREKRRWLRAVEHRTNLQKSSRLGPMPTLTEAQLRGWQSLRRMIDC